jgi:hypothetical protein
MPIIKLINEHQTSFDPEAIQVMVDVYVKACNALGLNSRPDGLTETLAKKIIEAAQTGERDPLRIYQIAIDRLSAQAPGYAAFPVSDKDDSKSVQ